MSPFREKISILLHHRFGLVALATFLLLTISLVTRIALLIRSSPEIDFTFTELSGIFFLGLFFDLANASYLVIPFVLFLWFAPAHFFEKNTGRYILYALTFLLAFGLLFNAIAEWLFWDEFNTRFNFIAVDYLVYTNEVLGNIRQSYPVGLIMVLLLAGTGGIIYLLRRVLAHLSSTPLTLRARSTWAIALLALPLITFFTVRVRVHSFSHNAYANELAGNGLYELFSAYRHNELDYEKFYAKIPTRDAFAAVRNLIKTRESEFTSADGLTLERTIRSVAAAKKLNVVMITVESLSADFLGIFGNQQHLTPKLDSLAAHSLVLTQCYATGTRTVRGLEALSLCVPPTPGQSIVRRPNNENLFTLGKVFREKGYDSKFIYGGYGYFDNMSYFFSHNGYTVVDRRALSADEIDYENVWGVADENLFTLATREIEKTVRAGKPVFAQIMTTSNHRPYTYPEGRIDIPSHTNREGAVKYTDYAIGKFIREARTKPWFDSTLFVIVADHCASSAGTTELPVNKYHIPVLIYSPAFIRPGKMERFISQIDLGPTLLGMLHFSYTSKFFGYDIFQLEPGRERLFISTYQNLGYLQNNSFVLLAPHRRIMSFTPDFATGNVTTAPRDSAAVRDAVVWYQTASYSFKNGLMK
jgi:phosphoglycerol transferase MdoB-like AlkP superfamily enzyme